MGISSVWACFTNETHLSECRDIGESKQEQKQKQKQL